MTPMNDKHDSLPATGSACFVSNGKARAYHRPRRVISAHTLEDVQAALREVDAALDEGFHAAGMVTYEAAPAFDPAFVVHPKTVLPLLWFGIYDAAEERMPVAAHPSPTLLDWISEIDSGEYDGAIETIHGHIAAGDTYQVNYTFPLRTPFTQEPYPFFQQLSTAQASGFHAYVDLGRFQVLSVSPELFFQLNGDRLITRPMKGTRPRGRWREEDEALARDLAASEKEQAENLMIVDLLRNDMGRVSETGSVTLEKLFNVERYPTIWQMTSTIASKTDATLFELFAALFPCGSVTGAPKVETMKIIHELEPLPRGIYCGAVGWITPERKAAFNVAIRTVLVDQEKKEARYHVGSGITWDAQADAEFEECRQKASVLSWRPPAFQLLESLLFEGEYFLLEEHLQRLTDSAHYFGYSLNEEEARNTLAMHGESLQGKHKVWLLADKQGALHVESAPAPETTTIRLGLSKIPAHRDDIFLYHKTTHRDFYAQAKATRPDCDDVLLYNKVGELTESTTANLIVEMDGEILTPSRECGLLAGTHRNHLLAQGQLQERSIQVDDLRRVQSIHLINSVRKNIPIEWVE
jgi:para-aminobenzoate synthetase / 4-amino-4-deoxychorismate lyase